MELIIRPAIGDDAPQIVALVNAAYRGDSSRIGWTTEADILEGIRTDHAEITAILGDPKQMILVGISDAAIVASVHLQKNTDVAFLGMFAVNPRMQSVGIGKQMLLAAEHQVQNVWRLSKVLMKVINVRHELLAFYERRGYQRTGEVLAFNLPAEMGRQKIAGLKVEVLQKNL